LGDRDDVTASPSNRLITTDGLDATTTQHSISMIKLLWSVVIAFLLEFGIKLMGIGIVAWSPAAFTGAIAFIVAAANVVFQPTIETTLAHLNIFCSLSLCVCAYVDFI